MFETGKVYKVKVESAPGQTGFGRATVTERKGNQLSVQIRTSKGLDASFPKGTRVWFVSDSSEAFSGLWGSSVIDTKIVSGQSSMVCSPPKLEPLYQRRRTPRVALDVLVQVCINDVQTLVDVRSRDISRSGIAIESAASLNETIGAGDDVSLIVHSNYGEIPATARIIRIEKNWLANKTIIGLEFLKLSEPAVATLDKVLVQLGGKPRNADAAGDPPKQESGLASWVSGASEVKGRFVGSRSEAVDESPAPEAVASQFISVDTSPKPPQHSDAAVQPAVAQPAETVETVAELKDPVPTAKKPSKKSDQAQPQDPDSKSKDKSRKKKP